jgi:hypothetical protein
VYYTPADKILKIEDAFLDMLREVVHEIKC